jgi:hypothetical protein
MFLTEKRNTDWLQYRSPIDLSERGRRVLTLDDRERAALRTISHWTDTVSSLPERTIPPVLMKCLELSDALVAEVTDNITALMFHKHIRCSAIRAVETVHI